MTAEKEEDKKEIKLINVYAEYFIKVLEEVDRKDPATFMAIAELAKGYHELIKCEVTIYNGF